MLIALRSIEIQRNRREFSISFAYCSRTTIVVSFSYVTSFINYDRLGSVCNGKCKVLCDLRLNDSSNENRNFDPRLAMTSKTPLACFLKNLFLFTRAVITYVLFLVSPTSLVRWSPFSASQTCAIQLHHVPFRRHAAASTFTRWSPALFFSA